MKTVFFITGNSSKFEEAKHILNNLDLQQKAIKIDEIQGDQEAVVIDKANKAFNKVKQPVIVDDTGIYFEAFNNFPGTYTKHLFKSLGFEGLKKLLKDSNKDAFFRCLVCYKDEKTTKVV